MSERTRIEVWADVVCPFCLLGKRRLEEAIERVGGGAIEVVHRAFELDPERVSMPVHEALAKSYGGGLVNARAMTQRVAALGRELGLEFDFDHAIMARTFDAHRLALFAQARGRGSEMIERLMHAHFAEGKDVSEHGVLRAIARDLGLELGEVDELLASNGYAHEVRADEARARGLRVNGVPYVLVDGRFAASGAQSVEAFIALFERAREERPRAVATDEP